MKKETYAKAHELQEKIAQLEYDIKLLGEQIDKDGKLIRFGGQFNVSAPIEVTPSQLTDFCIMVLRSKKDELNLLKEQFELL